jgi:DNA-directed RNA polymerase specialized sigma24 family protein
VCVAARRARSRPGLGAAGDPCPVDADGEGGAGGASPPSRAPSRDAPEQVDGSAGATDAWPADWLETPAATDAARRAIDALSPSERAVMTMRDVARCGADETSEALGISQSWQRALLHRARSSVRGALEREARAAA